MSTFDVVLHPTDFSEGAFRAFEAACSIARDHFASLVVVHVLEPGTNTGDGEGYELNETSVQSEECREAFNRMQALAIDVPVTFRIVPGNPVGAILNVAHEESADLIVINSRNHSQRNFRIHGDVAEGILKQAHCPVCCIMQPISSPASMSSIFSLETDLIPQPVP